MSCRTAYNKKIRSVACTLGLLFCSAGFAQQAPDRPVTPADLVLHYLQQDMFLQPGTGFHRVHIGQSFAQAAKIWGQPKTAQKRRLDKTKKWMYEAADGTVLMLSGEDSITAITVAGAPDSLYQSAQGARFGMTPAEVARLYPGAASRGRVKKLAYPRLGISFSFINGTLAAMQVFAPERP